MSEPSIASDVNNAVTVTLQPSGKTISIAKGQTVLSGASAAGVSLKHSCRVGHCRACIGKVIRGQFDPGAAAALQLTEEGRKAGLALLCQAMPLGDMEIEATEVAHLNGPQIIPTYVRTIKHLTDDVMELTLRLPPSASMRHHAGQHVDILLPDGQRRSYSMANAPVSGGSVSLTFHVGKCEGGAFSELLWSTTKARDAMTIEGPVGTFLLRDEDVPLVFLATGTGYAPIRAMIHDLLAKELQRPIRIYCGARTPSDLYMLDEVSALASEYPALSFIPVISRPDSEQNWPGAVGYVQDIALAEIEDVSALHVYACGSPDMVSAAQAAFQARGLPADSFMGEAFVTGGH